MELLTNVLAATVVAGTPLLLVALGELICERSGVLNLGQEGMMLMGAVAGFVAALTSGSLVVGVAAAILAGIGMSILGHIGQIKQFTRTASAFYPEITQRVLIVNAPWFVQGLWKAASVILPRSTKEKVQLHGSSDCAAVVAAAAADGLAGVPEFLGGTLPSRYVRPATHGTRTTGGPDAPPYGVHFRLRRDFPLDALPNEGARTVARALQRYGMYHADGGRIALTAQSDRHSTASWDGLLGPHDLSMLQVEDFEVIHHSDPIEVTFDCTRTPLTE